MAQEWWPEAVKRPGPASKAGYFLGMTWPKTGDIKHSAEGFWPGIYSVLNDLGRRASWHFTIGYDRVEQHYAVSMNCWHGGDIDDDRGVRANIDCVGIEHLGKVGQPLTAYQIEMTARLTSWLMEQRAVVTVTRLTNGPGWRVLEHNQVSDVPTSCPSGRIQWGLVLPLITKPEGGTRVKYTDEKLDDVFMDILKTVGKSLAIGNAAAGAIINHVANHPGGGPSTLMVAELADLAGKHAVLEASLAEFQEALDALEAAHGG